MVDGAAGDGGVESLDNRRQLRSELRGLRELAGLSGRDLARQIEVSQSTVSRIESGACLPTLPQVQRWAKAVGASVEATAWLAATLEELYTEVHPWRSALADRPHIQGDYKTREAQAQVVRCFQPSVMPGLLQTAEYARLVFAMNREVPYEPADLAAVVAARLDRQLALYDPARRFEFLITEAALRWQPGTSRSQLAQLDRVTSLSTLENVSIGLIPSHIRARTYPSHGFVIYVEDANSTNDSVVAVDTIHAGLTVSNADDVRIYKERWSLLKQMAVFDDQAHSFIAALAAEVRGHREREV